MTKRLKITCPHDLLEHNCLTTFQGAWPFKSKKQQTILVNVSGRVSANNDEMLKAMVLNHIGVGYGYPALFEQELESGAVMSILKSDLNDMSADIYALYPQSLHTPDKVQAFLDILQNAQW